MFSWLLLLLFSGLCGLLLTHRKPARKPATHSDLGVLRPALPPGPLGLPLIGSLHAVGKLPHRDLARLAKMHGPIMYLNLGVVPTVVVSSPSGAEQVLRAHDLAFANRPPSEIFAHMSYGLKSFAFGDYGPRWRFLRKLCVTGLLSSTKIESFRSVRREELDNFVSSVAGGAVAARAPLNLSAAVRGLVADVVCRMVFGKKLMEESMEEVKFSDHVEEIMRLLGAFNVNDFVPLVGWLDLQGLRRRAKRVRNVLDRFLDKVIDEHEEGDGGRQREPDFIDSLLSKRNSGELEFPLDRDSIKALIMDMLEGAMDTAPTAIEWAFSELLRHPTAMKKAQDELASIVGPHRAVDESDLMKLDYLGMVVKETLRLHPLAPLLFHHNKEECVIKDYRIPARSSVFVNVWAIGRDPDAWPNAEQFIPERFEGKDIDVRGLHYHLIPFGSGRRLCAGMNFGLTMISMILAILLHCFDWELPHGMLASQLDMEEKYGLTVPRANQLWLIPSLAQQRA